MRKLLYILLAAAQFVNAQCVLPEEFDVITGNTGANMTVMLASGFISSLPIGEEAAYVVATTSEGLLVGSATVSELTQNSIAIWGDDSLTPEVDGAVHGETVFFQLVSGTDLYDIDITESYITADLLVQMSAVTTTFVCSATAEQPVLGCTDELACNYNPEATENNGSCTFADAACESCVNMIVITADADSDGVCDESEIEGCIDEQACNYNALATDENGSCIYQEMYYDCNGSCINDFDMDGVCDEVDYDDGIGLDEIENKENRLVKMIDILGGEQKEHKKGMLLFYVYENGSVEKRFKL